MARKNKGEGVGGVFSKEEAKDRGLKVKLRTHAGGHIDPLANPGDSYESVAKARSSALKALSALEASLETNTQQQLDTAKAIFEGVRAIAILEHLVLRMTPNEDLPLQKTSNEELALQMASYSGSPNPSNFARGGVGPDIALDLNIGDDERVKLQALSKRLSR